MEYQKGSIKRVFVARFDDNDILLDELERIVKKERISCGFLAFIGALKKGRIVTGPKAPKIPPEPHWESFKDAWEIVGLGSIFKGPKGPEIHIHGTLGKRKNTLAGCVRKDCKVFMLVEAIIIEVKGIKASKALDPRTGLKLLKFLS